MVYQPPPLFPITIIDRSEAKTASDNFYQKLGLRLEHKTCDILAAERLRLMRFDNRLIIDSFQKAIGILKG